MLWGCFGTFACDAPVLAENIVVMLSGQLFTKSWAMKSLLCCCHLELTKCDLLVMERLHVWWLAAPMHTNTFALRDIPPGHTESAFGKVNIRVIPGAPRNGHAEIMEVSSFLVFATSQSFCNMWTLYWLWAAQRMSGRIELVNQYLVEMQFCEVTVSGFGLTCLMWVTNGEGANTVGSGTMVFGRLHGCGKTKARFISK